MSDIRNRADIPVEDKWATEDMFVSDAAWEEELATLGQDKEALAGFAGKLGESGKMLYDYLYRSEMTDVKASLLGNYCMRKSDEDTRDATYQAMTGKFMSVVVGLGAALSFDTPEIMAISDETLDRFYAECPELERYRRYLTNLRRKKDHILSPAEEKLLASAGELAQAPDTIYGMFADADIKFEDALDAEGNPHTVSQATFVPIQNGPDRVLRKNAYESLYKGFANFDFKFDSRDGQYKVFELNPRQGRSSFVVTAQGHNLARYLVDDVLLDKPAEFTMADGETLWTIIPKALIFEYVSDPELKAKAKELIRRGKMCNSLYYKKDRNFKRWLYFQKNQASYFKKYTRYFGNKALKD